MTVDLNIFNLENQPNEPFNHTLEVNFTHENFKNETIDLNNEHKAEYEQLFQDMSKKIEHKALMVKFETHPISLIELPPRLEHKALSCHLKYTHLGNNETFPVIISSDLSLDQETSLFSILSKNKDAIGCSTTNIR